MRLRDSLLCAAGMVLGAMALHAHAQAYPSHAITAIYPYPAGSTSDLVARVFAAEVGRILGQNVVVENRPGASGRNGLNAMATARKDGYLISYGSKAEMVQQGVIDPKLRSEPGRDYQPVSMFAKTYLVLAAHPSVPFRDMQGLIAYARVNPGKLSLSTSGLGTSGHLTTEALRAFLGIDIVHIPYKGGAASASAVAKGEVQLTVADTNVRPFIQSGQAVGIATMSPQRWRAFPDLPSMAEVGLPPIPATTWNAVYAPPGTPADIVATLHKAYVAASKAPELVGKLESLGLDLLGSTPEEFARQVRADFAELEALVQKARIKFN